MAPGRALVDEPPVAHGEGGRIVKRAGATGKRVFVAGALALVAGCAAALWGCASTERWPFEPQKFGGRLAVYGPADAPIDEGERAPADEDELPDGPVSLTVERAALLALGRNRDLRVQRLTPEIVATFEQIERGAFDPEVFARAQFSEDESVEISRATGELFGTTRSERRYDLGLRSRMPTGTDVEVGVQSSFNSSNRTPDQQAVRVGLTVTQSLLRGFGPAVNLARIRQARLDTVASLYELRGFTEAVLAETESAYWRLALAQRRIEIFEESLRLAQLQRDEVAQRIEIGVLPPTERAAADAEAALREQELIDARAELETLRLRLLRLLNVDASGRLDRAVTLTSDPQMALAPIEDLEERLRLALRARPDLSEARLRLEQARLETVVTRNGVLPRLDFFVTLGKSGFADSFGRAVRDLDGESFDVSAGLELSAAVGNRTARGLDRQSAVSRLQASEAIRNLAQIVELDVRIAAAEVERARLQIAASAATRELREEALRAEDERFRVGDSTSILVAQAQRDLQASRVSEVEALVAYRLALIELYLAEGSLLERRGLTVEPSPEQRASVEW